MAFRTNRSMHARNAASVFPEPVGAQINVVLSARMWGQPCSCGSVGVPNFPTNHSWTSGCAHSRLGILESSKAGSLNASPVGNGESAKQVHLYFARISQLKQNAQIRPFDKM